jgi:hypothetical protein
MREIIYRRPLAGKELEKAEKRTGIKQGTPCPCKGCDKPMYYFHLTDEEIEDINDGLLEVLPILDH